MYLLCGEGGGTIKFWVLIENFRQGAIIFYREGAPSVCDCRSPIFSGPPFAYVKKFCSPLLPLEKNFGSFQWAKGGSKKFGDQPSQRDPPSRKKCLYCILVVSNKNPMLWICPIVRQGMSFGPYHLDSTPRTQSRCFLLRV